jgi:hypothetical protein
MLQELPQFIDIAYIIGMKAGWHGRFRRRRTVGKAWFRYLMRLNHTPPQP